MKRSITTELNEWKNRKNRKPLIIRGARQVGKTYTINDFGKRFFNNCVRIDFEKNMELRTVFDGNLSPKRIIELLELESGADIIPGQTLLFFDEIQLCPRALAALRYFYEDLPDLHVIAAGSLLEFEMEKMSFPVGRVEFMYMYPLTFEEFLINTGNENLNAMRPLLFDTKPLEDLIHKRLIEKIKIFFIVGGMPEAVNSFIDNESFKDINHIQDSLVSALIQDLLKYEKLLDNDLVEEIMNTIPQNVGSVVKYSRLAHTASHYKIKQAVKTLEKALLITRIQSSSASGLPLGGKINKSTFKLCMVDIGVMQFLSGISPKEIIRSENLLATYKGSLAEQFIGQELKANGGSQNNRLFYWSRTAPNCIAVVDYLLVDNGNVYPLEIKYGPAGRLKSMHRYLLEHPQTKAALVFNTGNIGQVDKIHFMPIYTKLKV